MREIKASEVTLSVAKATKEINYLMNSELLKALELSREKENSPLGRQAIELLLENSKMASSGVHPLCQDTGLTTVFVKIGQEALIIEGSLEEAIQEGVRRATREGRLRSSVTQHPISRGNSGDNTPAIIHYEIVPGKGLKIFIISKGGGCENMSSMYMLSPAAGRNGVEEFVVQTIREKGAAACPPLIIGVGVGGNFETAPLLAKKALIRPLGELSKDPVFADMEQRLLERINQLGIGPQGWGGTITALSVAIEGLPCHIASLPVAVNIECHSHRVMEVKI